MLLVAVGMAVNEVLRRTRLAAKEARRLNSLLDVMDEGVAVCSGVQAVAVNTSLCRSDRRRPADARHLMISSFIADAIDRLPGEDELRLEFRDVGERKMAQQRVSFLAHHDAPTRLPNHELMHARLSEAAARVS